AEDGLTDGAESGLREQLAELPRRGMMDRAFDARDADVVDEPAPGGVAVPVDDHEPATRTEHAMHLGNGAVWVGIMVEAVGTGHDLERARGEWQSFAVTLDGEDLPGVPPPAVGSLGQHLGDQVDSPDARLRHRCTEPGREDPRPTPHVQDRDR